MKQAKRTFTTIAIASGIAFGSAAIAAGNTDMSESRQMESQTGALQYDNNTTTDNSVDRNTSPDQGATDTRTMGAGPASDADRSNTGAVQGSTESRFDNDLNATREPRADRN